MSVIYQWPFADQVNAFEMRISNNVETFASPYTKDVQVVDLLGEKWMVRIELPARIEDQSGAAREAFFDRLNGPVNLVQLWHLKRPVPLGSIRSNGTVNTDIAQLSNTGTLNYPSGTTAKAGDHISLNGQLVRILADTVSSGNLMPIEFLPRARALIPANSVVGWNKPTAKFMMITNGVPTVWRQGSFDATAIDFIEVP